MLIYLILIIIILAVGCFFKVNETKLRQKVYLLFVFSMLATVASLRAYTVGVDTHQYYFNYELISKIDWQAHTEIRYELGFFSLCKILYNISPDPQLLVIVTSCFICFSVGVFLYKNSNDVIFSSFLFISLNVFSFYLTAMRQALAISIILLGIEFLKKPTFRNIVFYILIVFLAMQFHNSAAIMIIPLFFVKMKYTNTSFLAALIVTAATFVVAPLIWQLMLRVFPSYAGYTDSEFADSNYFAAAINTVICLVMLFFGLVFSNKNNRLQSSHNQHAPVYGNNQKLVLSYDLTAYLLTFALAFLAISMRMSLLARFSSYFTVYYIIWIPNITAQMTNQKDKTFITFLTMVFTIAFFVVIALFRPEWHGVIPYEFFWEV